MSPKRQNGFVIIVITENKIFKGGLEMQVTFFDDKSCYNQNRS